MLDFAGFVVLFLPSSASNLNVSRRLLVFSLNMMDSLSTMMDFVFKMMNRVREMMNSVLKMMNVIPSSASTPLDSSHHPNHPATTQLSVETTSANKTFGGSLREVPPIKSCATDRERTHELREELLYGLDLRRPERDGRLRDHRRAGAVRSSSFAIQNPSFTKLIICNTNSSILMQITTPVRARLFHCKTNIVQ